MKRLLITGGAGFIGSNFIHYYLDKYKDAYLVNIDKLTYAGDLDNLKEVQQTSNYKFIQGDICDRELIESIFEEYKIEGIIHFAAETHVDNSIHSPEYFIKSNVNGTFTLLDVAKKHWMENPFMYKSEYVGSRFHHISTDEVYGTLGVGGYFTEETPYAPNSPYSASKAASDMLVRSYHHTFGMNTVITNCSNNYGPRQHEEKLIPKVIYSALQGKGIPVYGNGKNVRDWLYVADHCVAIDRVFSEGNSGETYNIGGDNERTNIEVVDEICSLLDRYVPKGNGSYKDQITFVKDRPGHDLRYAIDAKKIRQQLNWKAKETFATGIEKTVWWYVNKYCNGEE